MTLLLTDRDLQLLDMNLAIDAVESFLQERIAGTIASHPRTRLEMPGQPLVITPGASAAAGRMGLRVYPSDGTQVTAVWQLDGRLDVLHVGELLGAIRTGAIGGVALRHLAPRDAQTLALVGAGLQAWTQLRAALRVRPIRQVRLFRRSREERERLARLWSAELSVDVIPVESPREAVEGAEVVISSTPSPTPVVEAAWLRPGAHLSSLGPKYRGRTELGLDVVAQAGRIFCDFPEQYRREEPFILQGTPHLDRMQDLTAALGADRPDDESTLFLSHGLAGTEVVVAATLARQARELGIGQELELP